MKRPQLILAMIAARMGSQRLKQENLRAQVSALGRDLTGRYRYDLSVAELSRIQPLEISRWRCNTSPS